MINPKEAKRDYDGLEVVFDKKYTRGWMLKASYVWQKSRLKDIAGVDRFGSAA